MEAELDFDAPPVRSNPNAINGTGGADAAGEELGVSRDAEEGQRLFESVRDASTWEGGPDLMLGAHPADASGAAHGLGVQAEAPRPAGEAPKAATSVRASADSHDWLPASWTEWSARNAKAGDNFDKALKPLMLFVPTVVASTALGVASANLHHSEEKDKN